jgi:hypothetical protein
MLIKSMQIASFHVHKRVVSCFAVGIDRILQMKISLTRCDLVVVVGDEGAGEPVDPDPVVPTVGAN